MATRIWQGCTQYRVLERPARCKGDWNCSTYGMNKKPYALTIPKGEYALVIDIPGNQPLIYCKEHAKIMYRLFEEAKEVAHGLGHL